MTSVHASLAAADAPEILRRHASSFHWAGQLLAPDVRLRCARLYAICRTIDDLADLPVTSGAQSEAITRLSDIVNAVRRRDTSDALVAEANALFGSAEAAWAALEHLVATIRSDIGPVRIHDETALRAYADGAAGTVGVMMAEVLDAPRRPETRAAARELGIAMQYTNIARDVLEDAEQDRLYLPARWLGSEVTPAAIAAGEPEAREAAWNGVRALLGHAEAAYRQGWRGLADLPARSRLAIAVAAHVYRRIGVRIDVHGPAQYWQQRRRVGRSGKLLASLQGVGLFLRTSRPRSGAAISETQDALPQTCRDERG